MCVTQLLLEYERVVLARLHAREEAVERRDVDPRRVETTLERLHERRPGPRKGIQHMLADAEITPEQHLDQLRDELPQIRMQAVDVLRTLALRELSFRPRELEIDVGVQSLLSSSHLFFDSA